MILYSIVDAADIFYEEYRSGRSYTKKINGGFIELQNSAAIDNIDRVKRLYSTNPALYLDKRYYPY